MSRASILETVQDIFRDILDKNNLVLNDSMSAADVEGWDSLTHISIVSAIEKKYSIRFTFSELDGLKDIGKIVSAIDSKIKG